MKEYNIRALRRLSVWLRRSSSPPDETKVHLLRLVLILVPPVSSLCSVLISSRPAELHGAVLVSPSCRGDELISAPRGETPRRWLGFRDATAPGRLRRRGIGGVILTSCCSFMFRRSQVLLVLFLIMSGFTKPRIRPHRVSGFTVCPPGLREDN